MIPNELRYEIVSDGVYDFWLDDRYLGRFRYVNEILVGTEEFEDEAYMLSSFVGTNGTLDVCFHDDEVAEWVHGTAIAKHYRWTE